MAYCSKCGSKLNNQDNFCQDCGYNLKKGKLTEFSIQKEGVSTHSSKKIMPWVYIGLSALMLIIILLGVIKSESICYNLETGAIAGPSKDCEAGFTLAPVLGYPLSLSIFSRSYAPLFMFVVVPLFSFIYLVVNLIKKRFKTSLYLSLSGLANLLSMFTFVPRFGVFGSAILLSIPPILMMFFAIKLIRKER